MQFPVHKALLHRHLFLGGDRELMMSSLLLAGVGLYALPFWLPKLSTLALEIAIMLFLRELARRDPWFLPIMRRAFSTQGYRPARQYQSCAR